MCFTKFCFVHRLNFGVLLSKVFLYWNNKQLRVKQNILWIKWITSPDVNRIIVKSLTYCPTIIRLASLRPDFSLWCYLVSWLEHVLCVQDKTCKFFLPLSVIAQVIKLLNGIWRHYVGYFLTKLAKIAVHWSLTIIISSVLSSV